MDFSIFILLTSFQGINSISTVDKVTVRKGESFILPCQYKAEYIYNKKILRRKQGGWRVIVDSKSSSDRFSMSDDPDQRVFTVKITNMRKADEGLYRCEIEPRSMDEYKNVYISVTGSPRLYVHSQSVTGYMDESITIKCYYKLKIRRKNWCNIDDRCNARSLDGMSVEVRHDDYEDGDDDDDEDEDARRGVLRVTLGGLQMRHTGWYYCSVGKLQMPVHLTVGQRATTQKTTTQPANNTTTTRTTTTTGRQGNSD
ncbi:uncharacterized protein LOC105889245 [Clupea harengus]|uniref:Uncharacterized protein LOC105889245 n=1 Tax=Clupea harengus TaxID=7950 RepID=A0A6P8GR54_CLUHA|nr:uncharacterized protein LOC105889245 [Clupea harengus]